MAVSEGKGSGLWMIPYPAVTCPTAVGPAMAAVWSAPAALAAVPVQAGQMDGALPRLMWVLQAVHLFL